MTTGLLFGSFVLVFLFTAARGPREIIRTVYVIALFATPIWMAKAFGVFLFDFRAAVVIGMFCALIFRPFSGVGRPNILIGDLLALTLLISDQCSSIYWNDTTLTSPFEALRVWLWPYVMGRLLARSADDVDHAARVLWFVGLGLSIYALFEAITKVNPINNMFGKTFYLLEQGEGYRMGLKRAQGPLEHPIHFGLMMAMLWPWAMQAMPKLGRWGWIAPALIPAAVFVTVSRGAWAVGLAAAIAMVFFHFARIRFTLALVLLIGGGTMWFAQNEVMTALRLVIGEETKQRAYVLVKGRLQEYSGTLHRQLLSIVYADALRDAGWVGYNSMDNVRVPYPSETDIKFRSIDDYYLIVQLQYGTFGLLTLLAIGLCGLIYLAWVAWDPGGRFNLLAGGLFGACFGVMVILNTVAFPPGFSGPWLFSMGVATGLQRLRRTASQQRAATFRADPPSTGPLRNLRHYRTS